MAHAARRAKKEAPKPEKHHCNECGADYQTEEQLRQHQQSSGHRSQTPSQKQPQPVQGRNPRQEEIETGRMEGEGGHDPGAGTNPAKD